MRDAPKYALRRRFYVQYSADVRIATLVSSSGKRCLRAQITSLN
jgi:hypothetical protein